MIFSCIRKLGLAALCVGIQSSCVVPDDTSRIAKIDPTAAAARKEMVGLSEADVRMCAGFPTATADAGQSGQIWTYKRIVQRGNLSIVVPTLAVGAIPAVGGSVNVAPGGYCDTQIRMVDGRVAEVAYAGDNNLPNRRDALCVSTVDACVTYARQHGQRPAAK
ncbi:hypothetical protein EN962_09625 [Mesorhizobium sp. M7A.F.Ca.CA.001.09.2.1]|uniref:Lipoprotein SmpA/OmlA domain-containing protein n=1 Tax=Mesorhizobium ciceri TaxID=39645 RepID=A0AB38TC37_9HYPH|nr:MULTISPECIES: hypothetical protein [Mesorhizobium]RUY35271.1 hypothetical protein EN981_26650 [Mesorhizobium sp. M7A.F.Ca.CA.001.13.2.1]MDF3213361.1 hypothetical protein [Mesorhizobium ciceri]RUY64925.1 hypothetical protein EN980_24120 [Mesorhizobium sp. M7A.F.Ca.CA.001.13.1.1]RUY74644.1 hypothetical protein EN965_00405 [Mesorhizobium sp. M7A.F.Ca.CA.001.05.1.1]RUY79307.1 hypothetical protein EN962_09625 [Mesorhizobium sp. M7A.F.Ca.CA.001.09.2.1]